MSHQKQFLAGRSLIEEPAILLPKQAALRLQITVAMLRRLTERGAIGHVRLGTGEQRIRVGYTEQQLADFITARTVPPAAVPPETMTVQSSPRRRRGSTRDTHERVDVTDSLVKAAISNGRVTEWAHP